MATSAAIHEHVKGLVKQADITHAELAQRTGWSDQRVSRLLNGRTDLTAEDMRVLAVILDKPVADLYPSEAA